MSKGFLNFAVVLILFSISVVLLTWDGPNLWHDFVALVLAVLTGAYAAKTGFGRL
jgi:hypothetical protein